MLEVPAGRVGTLAQPVTLMVFRLFFGTEAQTFRPVTVLLEAVTFTESVADLPYFNLRAKGRTRTREIEGFVPGSTGPVGPVELVGPVSLVGPVGPV